ncbi:hypothetical protein DSL72_009499 [Monilinia vaccinii-corymbosi]|uniref:J domain-containing protein n=1 Tax=Monilinia vaccinii-corymbosi TaxID=61207 RepID=A0A8A3PRD3_9HELO|nr:hypothetical protein DSL72_009499 [Monilinia vaccinii-corymbosi]
MPSDDLTRWITSEVDFYSLLGITPESFTAEELRRAYRKTALRYHPDKLGDAFDPDKYEQFQAANDVLADPELKQKYDNYRNARVQKQRAAALFEGKRRAMKEDLEARERGGSGLGKRSREDEEMDVEIRRLAEEGRKRKAKRQSMMAENLSSPTFAPPPQAQSQSRPQSSTSTTFNPPSSNQNQRKEGDEEAQEDEVARLERLIAEAAAAKAKRKADKKARKSGIYNPPESPAPNAPPSSTSSTKENRKGNETPIKRPDIFNGMKADSKSAATSTTSSPRFSFSPNAGKKVGGVSDFAATMERLKEAERKRLEGEIKEREAREV